MRRFYLLFFRLIIDSLIHPPQPLTLKRLLVLLLLFPSLAILQLIHRFCFMLDDIFFPGYRDITIKKPLFIVGFPRSGTTFLHRLMAADTQRFTTFSLWELLFAPSITERKIFLLMGRMDHAIGGPLTFLLRRISRVAFANLVDIHSVGLGSPEEDYLLFLPLFACFITIIVFPWSKDIWRLSNFDRALTKDEKAEIMTYYKACIQRHLFVRGAHKRLLSKNPSFTSMVGTLKQHFPDCRIVCTARTPINVVPSLLSAMDRGLDTFASGTDKPTFQRQLLDMLRRYFYYIQDIISRMPKNRHAFVTMEQLRSDTHGSIRQIYERLEMELFSAFLDHLKTQSCAAKSYQSRHHFSLSQFGLDLKSVYRYFQPVFDWYGFPPPRSFRPKLKRHHD